MTIDLAIDYIRRRMLELGHADQYHLRFRHFVVQASDQVILDTGDQVFILVEPISAVSIESTFALYDLTADNSNELQYEHQGQIRINNYTSRTQHVRFIQVIPIHIISKQ